MSFKILAKSFASILFLSMELAFPSSTLANCRIPMAMPGSEYSESDIKKQSYLCSLDFYNSQIALCPKTWSTSAATVVYDLTNSENKNLNQKLYESNHCFKQPRPAGVSKAAIFKYNINALDTSSIWIKGVQAYSQLSRYLRTQVQVPVVVFKEMRIQDHFSRVVQFGPKHAESNLNLISWNWMYQAEKNPKSVDASKELFTPDLERIRGILYKDQGEKYGYEFIGSDEWGPEGSRLLFRTPAYRALRQDEEALTAIRVGLKDSGYSGKFTNLQMIRWMRDLTEIITLDYILSQQDRFGNIDSEYRYVYVEDGVVKSRSKTAGLSGIENLKPELVQFSHLNDNDESVRMNYENYTKDHHYMDNVFHFSGDLYRRLIEMKTDFQKSKTISTYLIQELGFNSMEVGRIERQLSELIEIIKNRCLKGKMRFDLDEPNQILLRPIMERKLNCDTGL